MSVVILLLSRMYVYVYVHTCMYFVQFFSGTPCVLFNRHNLKNWNNQLVRQ